MTFIISVTYRLTVSDAGSSGPRGSCSNANMRCSSPFKHLCALCLSRASLRALSIFAFRAVRKIHPTVPGSLCSKRELTAYNTFSMLAGKPSTTSQSSTGAHISRITTTQYHVLYVATGFLHPAEPQALYSLGILLALLLCSLRLLSLLSVLLTVPAVLPICSQRQLSPCISPCTLFAEPVVVKALAKRLKENAGSCRVCRCVYSLLAGAAARAADIA